MLFGITGQPIIYNFLIDLVFIVIRIIHIITGLHAGGAETALLRLLMGMDKNRFSSYVVSLGCYGQIGPQLNSIGIPVLCLGLNKNPLSTTNLYKLYRLIKEWKPDLIQGWMYHANIIALLFGNFLTDSVPVLWNIRHSLGDTKNEKLLTTLLIRFGACISNRPCKIIYNSKLSKKHHESIRYSPKKAIVIPNGFDCKIFKPSEKVRSKLRCKLGLSNSIPLVGMVARYHPIKDHRNFIEAAKILLEQFPNMNFVLVGKDVDTDNIELMSYIECAEVMHRIHLLGERSDVADIVAGFDVLALSSTSEAFPNIIGEAMASAIPCVSTDVGDVSDIIDDAGVLVAPKNPSELAYGISKIVSTSVSDRKRLGIKARNRIIKYYDLSVIVNQYESLYSLIATSK